MSKNNFADYITNDLLADVDGITGRPMFGGYSFYKDGVIFGMIALDVLYYKVDDGNIADYKKYSSKPFTYEAKNGKRIAMSYYEVPAEIMDSPKQLILWTEKAVAASKRSKKK